MGNGYLRAAVRNLSLVMAGIGLLVVSGCGSPEEGTSPAAAVAKTGTAWSRKAPNSEGAATENPIPQKMVARSTTEPCLPPGAHAKHSSATCTTCHLVAGEPCFDPAGPAVAAGQPLPSFDSTAQTCSNVACHGLSLTPAWTSGAALGCNGCHGTGTTDGSPDYPSGSPKANSHSLHDFTCNTCHAGTTADGSTIANQALHANGIFDLAPGAGVSFTYTFVATGGTCTNISCHFEGASTWGPVTSHLASLGPGEVVVFDAANSDHGAGFSIEVDCTLCHYASLVAQHANNCNICHAGANPAGDLIDQWNQGCSQASCHPAIHTADLGDDHRGMWWNSSSSCGLCHDDSAGDFPGPGDNCFRCHNPDLTVGAVGDHEPPLTTSNAQSNYVGPALIHLAALDVGTSGVSMTRYSRDGQGWVFGEDVYISAPSSGSRTHTLQFYSIDHAMNAETVKSVTFTVQTAVPDTTPPATTSSFNPASGAAFKVNQAVTLTATDNSSGVKATYYKVDTGAFTQGTSFTVSGDGEHTFSYYSVDNANQTETTHVSNTFRIDTVPPTTTCNAVSGHNYTSAPTFTLAASDPGGSGVASTWFRLDTGAWTAGTSVPVPAPGSGTASHTISWYSRDVATNVETTQSVSFTVETIVADTTPPTTTSSFNPAAGAAFKTSQGVTLTATDGGSGVKATYYKIDAGAFAPGASFTVTGEGEHSFSYYSVDNDDNTEPTHVSNTFRIDTLAPFTTCNAVTGTTYIGPQTFTLLASDTGSGVAGRWYRIDAGPWTPGASIAIPAPASGSTSHTIEWYSIDAAGNQEGIQAATFMVVAAAGGTTTLSFRTSCAGGSSDWVYWEVRDATGNPIAGMNYENDDCGHYNPDMWADFVVPSGAGYILYGEFWDYGGTYSVSETRTVSPSEATPGATVEWWFY